MHNKILTFFYLLLLVTSSFKVDAKEPLIFLSVIFQDIELGEIPSRLDEKNHDENYLQLEAFEDYFSEVLEKRVLAEIKRKSKLINNELYISLGELKKIGIEESIDHNKLEVKIDFPANFKQKEIIDLGFVPRKKSGGFNLEAEKYSAYLNIYHNQPISLFSDGLKAPQSTLNFYSRLNKGVLESTHQIEKTNSRQFKRIETSYVFDRLKNSERLRFGDIRNSVTSFQSSFSMGGFSIQKDLNLRPDLKTYRDSTSPIVLNSNSEVEIYINDLLYRTLILKKGVYEIKDLPVNYGFTDLKLVIKDSFGKTEELYFPVVSKAEIFKKGYVNYSHFLGFKSSFTKNDLKYDPNKIIYSGFVKQGMSDRYTLGVNIQSFDKNFLLGLENYIALPVGIVNFELGSSSIENQDKGYAYKTRFNSWFDRLHWIRDWGVSFEYFQKNFSAVDSKVAKTDNKLLTEFFINPKVSDWFDFQLALSRNASRVITSSVDNIIMRFIYTNRHNFNISQELKFSDKKIGDDEKSVIVNMNFTDDEATSSHIVNYQSVDNLRKYEGTVNGDRANGSIGFDRNHSQDSLKLKAAYNFQRLLSSLDYTRETSRIPDDQGRKLKSQEANLNLSTSLVFLKQGLFFSEPIYNSFFVVEKDESLKNYDVNLSELTSRTNVTAKPLNHFVVPGIESYRPTNLLIEAGSEESIVELNEDNFQITPKYRSGFYKKVSLFSNFFVRGQLKSSPDVSLALSTFSLRSKDNTNQVWSVFTNREGIFEIERILPGSYLLELDGYKSKEIKINKTESSLENLGEIVLEKL